MLSESNHIPLDADHVPYVVGALEKAQALFEVLGTMYPVANKRLSGSHIRVCVLHLRMEVITNGVCADTIDWLFMEIEAISSIPAPVNEPGIDLLSAALSGASMAAHLLIMQIVPPEFRTNATLDQLLEMDTYMAEVLEMHRAILRRSMH